MKINRLFIASSAAVLVAACSQPVKQAAPVDPYPSWYYSASEAVPNALSTASCVAIPAGNLEIARKKALVNGKADIAGQIETRVKAMDKAYDRMATTDEGDSVGGTFESVTKQVANQALSGVRAIKSARVTDAGKPYFCSLVSLDPTATKSLIDSLIRASGSNLSSANESVLREQFNAYKAQQELEGELNK